MQKRTSRRKTVNKARKSNGKVRSSFALPKRKMFPLNTKGRVMLAPGAAGRAKKKGTISESERKQVLRKAAAARKRFGIGRKNKK